MNFAQKLARAIAKNNSLRCVNLDPETENLFEFNKKLIDATQTLVCCYKPNSAFYEAQGATGIEALKKTVDYIHKKNSEIPVILDAKRGDIGNSNKAYAKFAFEYIEADAITVAPYSGGEALAPFLDQADKGIIVWCRSSNNGAGEFQDLFVTSSATLTAHVISIEPQATRDPIKLYEFVAHQASKSWNKNNNVMLVVGATYPADLKKVR